MARFTRTMPAPVVKGGYGAFLPFVRADFEQCCAYCYLHERYAAGEENFELDHFKPRWKFPELVRDYYNIYYSCHPCNSQRKKGQRWPSDELIAKGICYVDLCRDNFEDHYELLVNGALRPLTKSAEYTIDAIKLNSDHLVKIRSLLISQNRPLDREPNQAYRE